MFQSTEDKVLLTGIGLALVFIHIGLCYIFVVEKALYLNEQNEIEQSCVFHSIKNYIVRPEQYQIT